METYLVSYRVKGCRKMGRCTVKAADKVAAVACVKRYLDSVNATWTYCGTTLAR